MLFFGVGYASAPEEAGIGEGSALEETVLLYDTYHLPPRSEISVRDPGSPAQTLRGFAFGPAACLSLLE